MINQFTIARPYASAAFSAAKACNEISLWSQTLKQLSLMIKNKEMQIVLANPKYTKKQQSELVISCLHKITGNESEKSIIEIEHLLQLLAEKKRLLLIPFIAELFENDCAKTSGSIALKVTSAFAVNEVQKKQTQEKLAKQLNATCDIDFNVDEKLIGGLLVRSGSWVMDGSIKNKLQKLESILV